ncbi:MAG: hypothetical protein KDC92_15810 [Bacteroidetes bacterium]|nr:hypothetical protein [Bacteroidota bacterium]
MRISLICIWILINLVTQAQVQDQIESKFKNDIIGYGSFQKDFLRDDGSKYYQWDLGLTTRPCYLISKRFSLGVNLGVYRFNSRYTNQIVRRGDYINRLQYGASLTYFLRNNNYSTMLGLDLFRSNQHHYNHNSVAIRSEWLGDFGIDIYVGYGANLGKRTYGLMCNAKFMGHRFYNVPTGGLNTDDEFVELRLGLFMR